jgi:hypothetical protein
MKDKYYYICDGKINDLVVAPVAGSAVLNPIMACQDKKLRVLSEKGSDIIFTHNFDSSCVSISQSPDNSERSCPIVGYGLSNGAIGVLELYKDKSETLWQLEPSQINMGNCAPVTQVKICKLGKKYMV